MYFTAKERKMYFKLKNKKSKERIILWDDFSEMKWNYNLRMHLADLRTKWIEKWLNPYIG